MQIMPRTARSLGIGDIRDPESSIHAGTKYMSQLIERLDPTIPLEDRVRLALASYNVGYGHVEDARRIAGQMGWSADKWFENVEKAMLLLEKPQHYSKARNGYCRCSSAVEYVFEIQTLYDAYAKNMPEK